MSPTTQPTSREPGGLPDREAMRAEFPILARKTYLNSNSLGALSRAAMDQHARFQQLWNELGASAWYEIWTAELDRLRGDLATTLGAPHGSVALMPSVSAGLAAVAGALAGAGVFDRRPRVVTTELDFPTVGHQFASRSALGIELEIVTSPDGVEVPLERFEEALDSRTGLVVTSHVCYGTGAVQDVAAVARLAHDRGAYCAVDAYQSIGQVQADAEAIGADFVLGGALKWLCGGPGLAFLQVAPHVDLAPTTLSWFGTAGQFEFDIRDARPRTGARRFELGTPATGAAYTAAGGLSVLHRAGLAEVITRARELADDLRTRLLAAGYRLREAGAPERRSCLILVEHPDASGTVRELAARNVVLDHRGSCLRFSPHFYNSFEDNERAVGQLVEIDRSAGRRPV